MATTVVIDLPILGDVSIAARRGRGETGKFVCFTVRDQGVAAITAARGMSTAPNASTGTYVPDRHVVPNGGTAILADYEFVDVSVVPRTGAPGSYLLAAMEDDAIAAMRADGIDVYHARTGMPAWALNAAGAPARVFAGHRLEP